MTDEKKAERVVALVGEMRNNSDVEECCVDTGVSRPFA